MPHRCAILDDYQKVALKLADWSAVAQDLDIEVFSAPMADQRRTVEALRDAEIVCLMRERTPFTRAVIEALPKLKLVVTTGMRNAAIDVAAAQERGVVVCGTATAHHPTAELAFGLLLDLARKISSRMGSSERASPGRRRSASTSSARRSACWGSASSGRGWRAMRRRSR
jgi:phosphoglycerate dehydrogenase-like enzyme